MKIKPKDIIGKYNLKINIKKSEPACMDCLPPAPLNGHPMMYGVLVHSRIDCPNRNDQKRNR